MRAEIASPLSKTVAGAVAEQVLRACVHCGMCNATCPTYQLTGDELDGPRGRIYLIKQVLEGKSAGRLSQVHLDRCLSCRACETTCPSGVEYHRLYDIGKEVLAQTTSRPWRERLARLAIRMLCVAPWRMKIVLDAARPIRFLLPKNLRGKIMPKAPLGTIPQHKHARRMTLLEGCVQAAAAPQINAANRRVFDSVGIQLTPTAGVGCCGALSCHLGAMEEGRALARRNIDAWIAELDAGAEAIVVNASGCAAFIRDYADLLADDPNYAVAARRVANHLRDPIQILKDTPPRAARAPAHPRIAVHDPCTLRNGPGLADAPKALLANLGYDPQPVADGHLCCGSAGAYSLLQPKLANKLRNDKLAALTACAPQVIYTANIGCLMHLSETSPVPVRHWIEAVDDLIGGG